jgi:mono/diheme cytochrome c family protein
MNLSARALVATFGIVVAGLTIGLIAAQQPPSRSGPSFTAAQADAGRSAYDASCSGCHLRDLKGSFEAPQLAGGNFLNEWGDKTVADLHTYLMASMPPTDPGAPGSQTMINIVAYILQANGARAGSQTLTPQSTATIRSALGTTSGAPAAASRRLLARRRPPRPRGRD